MNNKNRIVLEVLVGILIIVAFWFTLLSPTLDKKEEKEEEIAKLNDRVDYLNEEITKEDEYKSEIERINIYSKEVEAQFPGFITQERVIHTVKEMEDTIDSMYLTGYSISPVNPIFSSGETVNEQTGEKEFKNILLESKVNISTVLTYEDMKALLFYINNYHDKLSIESLNINKAEDNKVNTSFTLNFYGLLTPYISFVEDFYGDFDAKQDQIFTPFNGYGGFHKDVIKEETVEAPDMIININSSYSDLSTTGVYLNGSDSEKSYISSDGTDIEPLEIVFGQSGDRYYVKYKNSLQSYPTSYNGIEFKPGSEIGITIKSSARVNNTDKAGINATIVNQTDKDVVVRTESDDARKPRFNILSSSGNVIRK